MSCIRPVTQRFPASQDVWEDSNLPFACVLTPLADNSTTNSNGTTASTTSNTEPQATLFPVHPPLLTRIAKCLHCGAPHPSQQTHYRPGRSITTSTDSFLEHHGNSNSNSNNSASFLFCYLCGRDSSTSLREQQLARKSVDGDLSAPDPALGSSSTGSSSSTNSSIRQPYSLATSNTNKTANHTFALPLRLLSQQQQQQQQQPVTYSIPATQCPVLWFVVLDGSCVQRRYWHAASQLLSKACRDMPAHVHVSIVMASSTTQSTPENNNSSNSSSSSPDTIKDHTVASETVLAVYQLASSVPHVLHYTDHTVVDETDLMQALLQSLVPADGAHQSHILAAARSLMDYTGSSGSGSSSISTGSSSTGSDAATTTTSRNMPLGWTIQMILEALQSSAQPVGQRRVVATQDDPDKSGNTNDTGTGSGSSSPVLPYAGGRIMALLADRPADLTALGVRDKRRKSRPVAAGMGGFGGRIVAEPGERFGNNNHNGDYSNHDAADSAATLDIEGGGSGSGGRVAAGKSPKESDLTADHLLEHYRPPPGVEAYFSDLGAECAQKALGVDVLLLVDSSDEEETIPDFGLPLFSCLADRSGAPGPLLFDLNDPESAARLEREFTARTPWHGRQVFGAELRLRMSPGFGVETASIEPLLDQKGPQLAPLVVQAGLMGPATAVNDSTHLWRMGTCDPFTSFTVDLNLKSRTIQDRFPIDGFGEMIIKPVVQTCFAYTTVVKDDAGQYRTVRQLRITSFPVPLADSAEALYSSLDPEALAVVLFHKLVLAAFQDGLKETAVIADNWLESLLACAYRSAKVQEGLQSQLEEKGIQGDGKFLANERLLDREGELSAEEVLLAQGHTRLRTVPLMTYLLVQCDALRQSQGAYQPSMDLRCAALLQMLSMTPTNLTRCIAPRLQLWASRLEDDEDQVAADDCPILDIIDLRSEAVQLAVMEFAESEDLILFLDSPDQLVVMDARYVNASADSDSEPLLQMSPGLEKVISESIQSYRTQPAVAYELGQAQTSGERTFLRLLDALIEDAPSPSGHDNFHQWRSSIAASIHE